MAESSPITDKTLFVLGAGVDVALGFPTMNNLLSELARFSIEEGKDVEKAVRKHVKGLRFNLSKRAGEQGEQFGELLISSHSHLIEKVKSALDKHSEQGSPKVKAMRTVVEKLDNIRASNHLDDETCKALAEIAGENAIESGGDDLFNPRGLTLTNAPRQAIRKVFQGALTEIEGLTDEERTAMQDIVRVVSNFEEMLGEFFSGFFTKHVGNQKKYYYLAWLFWAYLHVKQFDAMDMRDNSFYKTLAELGNHNVITFNYTRFYITDDYSNIAYFHGGCGGYIRFDNREYIARDDRIDKANCTEDIVSFLNAIGEEINWDTDPPRLLIPAIVPPLSVKPIICNEYLDLWASAGHRIEQADRIVIVGYSFNVADEHFNDLIRKRNTSVPICMVNPDIETVKPLVCKVLGIDHTNLTHSPVDGISRWKYGRLSLFEAKAEEMTAAKLRAVLS